MSYARSPREVCSTTIGTKTELFIRYSFSLMRTKRPHEKPRKLHNKRWNAKLEFSTGQKRARVDAGGISPHSKRGLHFLVLAKMLRKGRFVVEKINIREPEGAAYGI